MPLDDDFLSDQLAAGVEVEYAPKDEPEEDERGIGGGDYAPRLTCPSKTNRYYLTTGYGGLNKCIKGKPAYTEGSALANCVGYSWGRAYEILNKEPKLSRSNAENWWSYKDGYERSQTPHLGDIACWRKGKAGDASDGAGHVAVVEEIIGSKVKLSQSGYNSSVFYLTTYDIKSMSHGSYTFQGYIHIADFDEETEPMTKYTSGIVKSYTGGKSVGLSAQKAAISGHACDIALEFNKGSLPSGDTLTVQLADKFKPSVAASGCGYWSKSAYIAQADTTGKLTIRNTGSGRTFTAKSPLRISLSYLID